MQALTARILTAVVLGTVVVGGIFHLPAGIMNGFFAVIAFLGALEWALLAGVETRSGRLAYGIVTLLLAGAVYRACLEWERLDALFAVACAWWLVASAWVIRFQTRGGPRIRSRVVLGCCGWLVLIPAVSATWLLLEQDPRLLLALFAMVWSADILAFFGGRALGRRRLASRVSPGKTWEGLLVALAGTLVLAAISSRLLQVNEVPMVLAVVLVTVLSAAVGDLLESLLKRLRGLKDSGALLPGHGGVLDRIDSLLAAAPIFAFGWLVAAPS